MTNGNEAFSRVFIDAQLKDQGWNTADQNSVRYEYVLKIGRADYVLCDRHGRSLAVIEAKRFSISPGDATEQAKAYAQELNVPYIFLANGKEILFWEWEREAFPHPVKTFFKQDDLERRFATHQVRQDPLAVPIDTRIAGGKFYYQTSCIDTLCREIGQGRRKLLVEMATGTGKTRTAAAFIKRLFQAHAITRVLFLVDRIPLAKQTEDAFAEHLPDYPAYVLRAGRRFQDEKQITITTLQSMINTYGDYSSGYFDLIISDECHRSIYGKWSGVLKHFDGIQVGLTATPCKAGEDFDNEDDTLFVRDTLRFFEVDKPTFTYKLKDAIRDGFLVPYHIYKALTVKTAAEGGFEVKRDALDWSAMDATTRAEFDKLFEDAIGIVTNLIEWQQKYNLIDAPIEWGSLHDSMIVRSGRNADFARKGTACFLMRDPQGGYRNEPVTDSKLRTFWIYLLDELERRVAARGEVLPDGSPILFIDKRDTGSHEGYPLRPVYDLHTLRVSLLTALATEGGVPIHILSKCIAGHASILMTLYYVKMGIPYITEKLAEAQKKIGIAEQKNFCQFLQSAEYKELESVVVSNDATGLKALQDNTPGSWVIGDKGICPVGGSLCNKGGPKMTSNVQMSDYTPTPGGPRNCVRCRFLITGPAFLGGLVAHFNAIGVSLMEASERLRNKEMSIRRLEDKLALAEADDLPFARMTELNAAYDRQERDLSEVDEIAHNWHATYRLIEHCKAILGQEKPDPNGGRINLVLSGGMHDLEAAIEMTTDFELMNAVCQVANVYPGENSTMANLRRSKILDAMLIRNNRHPVFATLTEDEALSVGNEFVSLLMARLGKSDTAALMDGRKMLESSGITEDAERYLERHVGGPIHLSAVIDGHNSNQLTQMIDTEIM